MNADFDDTEALTALANRLEAHGAIRSAAVHTPQSRSRPWIEVLVDDLVLGPPVLREIADHHAGVAEVVRREGYLMADVRAQDQEAER
jgi:hypothetical protein